MVRIVKRRVGDKSVVLRPTHIAIALYYMYLAGAVGFEPTPNWVGASYATVTPDAYIN